MDLLEVERQRALLEQNLAKLKASLKHFQTLTAEYEGLSEEIQAGADDLDLQQISKTYPGDIVNEDEIRELAGIPKSPRPASQVLDLISKRQEYVQKNIETLQRQFWDAEAKLEELDFAAFSSRENRESSLPLTEIHEELDDDGNVVSSTLSQPEASTAKLVDTLRKAGLSNKDLEASSVATEGAAERESDESTPPTTLTKPPPALVHMKSAADVNPRQRVESDDENTSERPSVRKKSVSFTADTKPPPTPLRQESQDGKRSVSFNDKVAVMPAAPAPDTRSVSFAPQVEEIPAEPANGAVSAVEGEQPKASETRPATDMQKTLREFMFKPDEKVREFDSDDNLTREHIVLPENESEEDAATRREMLEYHLNEVGHVVAQMDLDEDDFDMDENGSLSDFPSSEYPEEDTPYTSGLSDSDRESEDEFGRSTRPVISDDYHKEMKALQQKLIGNLGPAPSAAEASELGADIDPQHVHRLVVKDDSTAASASPSTAASDKDGKKRVSFAEAPTFAQEQSVAQKVATMLRDENETPLADVVSERTKSTGEASSSSLAPKASSGLPSRLKTSQKREDQSPAADATPTGPSGQIIADELIERPTRATGVNAPSIDEPDAIMQRRELAEEYYRRRNDMIRQQGGFKASADEDDDLMEERDGKVKKVSRFRAARIK
ncbi:hypothetical protein CKM354_000262100 [Cercospora kikuchii]|uniref:DUF3835 domain-containing protein n=1 Tax=Cercospora kikuchii TaxID=84275 RepID=A0A9P3CF32_9PEZI|nr:uncharacterized protein CKM354_000262100 [Cercospora kikuchii]GIZ39230.1 hypothetical protein CKM354_000262100 [Cercospora kikuchii]